MKNVRTIGTMDMFSIVDRRLFQCIVEDRRSDAMSSAMRHMRLTMLRSETPIIAKVLSTGAVLIVLGAIIIIALMVLLIVLNVHEII